MKAFVLAAGYATRLFPLTRDCAKPLLEVGGAPLLTHLVRRLETLEDLSEIVVIANHRFAEAFARWQQQLGCSAPLRVLDDGSSDDADKLGALGDLAFALDRAPLGGEGGEDWLVVAGDNLLLADLRDLVAVYRERREPLLVLREVEPGGGPSAYNEVTLGAAGRVVGFREKPPDPRTGLAAIAFYVFPPAVADLLRRYLDEGGNRDAPGHFIAWLVERAPVRATRLPGEWFEIGNFESLEAARARFAGGIPAPQRRGGTGG